MTRESGSSVEAVDLASERRQRAESLIGLYYRNIAEMAIISLRPLIIYIPIDTNISGFVSNYKILFDSLRSRKAHIICPTYWYFEKQKHIDGLKAAIDELNTAYPNLTFTFLANTANQHHLFREQELNAYFCNHNCMVDEKIFHPVLGTEKKFDAVYDARLDAWKRHGLAVNIESVGLIYHRAPDLEDASYVKAIRRGFDRAKFFNHSETGEYETLTPQQVNLALNQCRVGLCLSAEEGAMFASVQYLLAGLPVITTPSLGGRDVFFDDEIAITVEPTPEAVENGVREMVARNFKPEYVREKTIERVLSHRGRFIDLVQRIYDREGVGRRFADDFDKSFTNKLLMRVNLNSVIQLLQQSTNI